MLSGQMKIHTFVDAKMNKVKTAMSKPLHDINFKTKGPFTPSVSINATTMPAILLSLKTMESLQNRIATHFSVIPLFSMRAVSLTSQR